ncbi:MAG: hypothetical protein D6748_14355, partial [Calditrichaeota bacterium]
RVFTKELQQELLQELIAQYHERGYYFVQVDSHSVHLDLAERKVALEYWITPQRPLILRDVQLANIDSMPSALQKELQERIKTFYDKPYTSEVSQALSEAVIRVMENHGYPLTRLNTESFHLTEGDKGGYSLHLSLELVPGDSVNIAYLQFPRRSQHLQAYLQRVLRFQPGQTYRQEQVERYLQILQRQEFIEKVQKPLLAKDKKGRYFLALQFKEPPSTSLDGIIGYIPPPATATNEKGYFTGLINISIRNLFGGGRKFQVFWQKQDQFSDEFRLNYREPFVLGLPFHTSFGLNRLVRDTTYIEWRYHLDMELPLTEALSAFVVFNRRSVTPDSLASRQLRLPLTTEFFTETGIRWDRRDNPRNPRHGVHFEIGFSIGSQKNKGPLYLLKEDSLPGSVSLRRLRSNLTVYLPTYKNQVLTNHLHLEMVDKNIPEIQQSDQIWFGGATSVRGYRESQFFGEKVFWANSEYRFLLGPIARFFLFVDNAYFTRSFPEKLEKWLLSYGLGLRFSGPLGVVQVDFGLERGAPFQEGKLHFRLINEF